MYVLATTKLIFFKAAAKAEMIKLTKRGLHLIAFCLFANSRVNHLDTMLNEYTKSFF